MFELHSSTEDDDDDDDVGIMHYYNVDGEQEQEEREEESCVFSGLKHQSEGGEREQNMARVSKWAGPRGRMAGNFWHAENVATTK